MEKTISTKATEQQEIMVVDNIQYVYYDQLKMDNPIHPLTISNLILKGCYNIVCIINYMYNVSGFH